MSGSSFWGTVVKSGKNGTPLRTKASQLTMVLKQAALVPEGKSNAEPSVLSVQVGVNATKFVLCHLAPGKCEQWAMDLGFSADEEVTFFLTGKNQVHLTGFFEDEDEDEDDFEGEDDDDEEEEDDDDELEAPKSRGALPNGKAAKKQALVEEEADSEDDGEEDEGEEEEEEEGEEEEGEEEEGEEEFDDDLDMAEGEEDDGEEDDDSLEGEDLAADIAAKRAKLFEGVDMKDLVGDDDDDNFGEEGEESSDEGEEEEGEEEEEEGEEEEEEGEEEDEEEDEEEEEEAPPPASSKKRPAASPAAGSAKKAKGAVSTPVQAPKSASKEGVMGWTPKEEKALKAAVTKLGPETPNRWDKVAKEVGSKGKDACKKHAKEI